jgi:outer membrane lipase/esterase
MKGSTLFHLLRRGFVALATSICVSTTAMASYSQVVFFGDSLSDTGNLYLYNGTPATPPYYNGQFSNGPLWTQNLAAALGFSATPSLTGGNNYAWAGATVIDYGRPMPVLPTQLSGYLTGTGGFADPSALYVILGGANDINDAGLDPSTAAANIVGAANAVDAMVDALYAAGARNILVGNLPDIGLTPLAVSAGPAAAAGATALTQLFNSTLASLLDATELASAGLDLDRLDLFGLLNDAVADPAAFGFSDVATPCYDGALGAAGGTVCANPGDHLFWDAFHPSAKAHRMMAATALAAVPEPAAWALFMAAAMALLWSRRRT